MRSATLALAAAVAVVCDLPGRVLAQSGAAPPEAAAEVAMTSTECQRRLVARHAAFAFTGPIAEGACAIPLPVRLRSLALGSGDIAFTGAPTLDCRLAERLADWIGNVVEPLARHHLGDGLAAIETGPGYVCRNRNNAAAGKLSEHAKGNALDIAAFTLGDGRRIAVRLPGQLSPAEAAFFAAVRTTACGYFLTVLGPGSDDAHAGHLHVDLGLHGRTANYRICE
jgi:hypothetical protein